MRFKTKELMVTVMPRRGEVLQCARTVPVYDCYPTFPDCARTTHVDLTPYIPGCGPCTLLRSVCWQTNCRGASPFVFELVCRAATEPEIETLTPRVRDFFTPIVAQDPDQLGVLQEELAATQKALEEIETRISTPASVEEAERVEASLKEALAEVQEQKKALVKKAEKKKKG